MHEMQDVSSLFASLRHEDEWEPSPGFYAGVVRQVEQQVRPSFAGLFSLDFALGRRLAFASLVMLAIMGSYLITRETSYSAGPSPETIMAEQNAPNFDSGPGHDKMLVTMTAYEQR